MRRHIKYLWYVIRHKWFVFVECIKLGVPLGNAIFHDWHKFLPNEWFSYAKTFYKPNGEKQYNPTIEFNYAWNEHQKRGKHHWQHWMITWDKGNTECLEMPDKYVLEMIADWKGAGKALGKPNTLEWYTQNKNNIQLHKNTRKMVEQLLNYQ